MRRTLMIRVWIIVGLVLIAGIERLVEYLSRG